MKIKSLRFKNLLSYGNKEQRIDFTTSHGLYLITGQNGAGKCVAGDTKIRIRFTNNETQEKFKAFLAKVLTFFSECSEDIIRFLIKNTVD